MNLKLEPIIKFLNGTISSINTEILGAIILPNLKVLNPFISHRYPFRFDLLLAI